MMNLNGLRGLLWFALLSGLLAGAFVSAQIPKGSASYTLETRYSDAYMFRGHLLSDEAVLGGRLGVGIAKWSYDLDYLDATDNIFGFDSEYRHTLSYTTVNRNTITTTGYTYYDYSTKPGGIGEWFHDTQEFFYRVEHSGKWNPSYGVVFDFDAYKGYYLDFSLTRLMPLTRRSQLVFGLRGGFGFDMDLEIDRQGNIKQPGFFGKNGGGHGSAHLKYFWQISRPLKFLTEVGYHQALDDYLHENEQIDKANTVIEATLTYTWP